MVNRYTPEKRRGYPLGLALMRAGAVNVPVDVRAIRAWLDDNGTERMTVAGSAGHPDTDIDELGLDGFVWRVSEGAFGMYADIQRSIGKRHPLVNSWECARICASKWRTSVTVADAGIRVVPTFLLVPGMAVPAFPGTQTVIKPCAGAGGRGVRIAEAGTDPGISEPYVAQPMIGGPPGEQIRALVAGCSSVHAMVRVPPGPGGKGVMRVNNIEAGGVPEPADAEPVRDIALATARCLGGDVLGVDLVKWKGDWAVLEVNSSPGLDGIARVTDADCYGIVAKAVLSRLRAVRAGHVAG